MFAFVVNLPPTDVVGVVEALNGIGVMATTSPRGSRKQILLYALGPMAGWLPIHGLLVRHTSHNIAGAYFVATPCI